MHAVFFVTVRTLEVLAVDVHADVIDVVVHADVVMVVARNSDRRSQGSGSCGVHSKSLAKLTMKPWMSKLTKLLW